MNIKTYSSNINGNIFSAKVKEPLYPQVQILFKVLEKIPSEKIKNGYSIEIGFSVFSLVEREKGYCIVVPDYMKNPFSDKTEDLTIALWVQLEQTDLLRLCNLEGESVRFDDKLVVAKNVLQEKYISLQRYSDLGKDASGWCVESVVYGEDKKFQGVPTNDYETIFAYHLLKFRPALLKALALPYEYIAVFDGETINAILNGQNENIME